MPFLQVYFVQLKFFVAKGSGKNDVLSVDFAIKKRPEPIRAILVVLFTIKPGNHRVLLQWTICQAKCRLISAYMQLSKTLMPGTGNISAVIQLFGSILLRSTPKQVNSCTIAVILEFQADFPRISVFV